jgi:hypothetical protein
MSNDTGEIISGPMTRLVILLLSAAAVIAFGRVVLLVMGGN